MMSKFDQMNEALKSPVDEEGYLVTHPMWLEAHAKLKAAEAKVEAIKKYTQHELSCDRNKRPIKVSKFEVQRRPCSCGLDDLLKEQTK